jgi:hypothetical protein
MGRTVREREEDDDRRVGPAGQYRPFVQYDSLESYHTDSAGVITDHPGNSLKRLDGNGARVCDGRGTQRRGGGADVGFLATG